MLHMSAFDDYKDNKTGYGGNYNPYFHNAGLLTQFFNSRKVDEALNINDHLTGENPYADAAMLAERGKTMAQYTKSAVEFQAERQAMLDKAELDRILRDEDRAYNTTAAQIARDRAAGLNPDLKQGPSGSSGASGTSVVADPISAPLDKAESEPGSVFGSILSSVVSLYTGVGELVNVAASMTSFKDRMQTVRNQARQSEIDTAMKNYGLVDNIVKSIPPEFDKDGKQVPVDAAKIMEYAKAIGISEPADIAKYAEAYATNPAVKDFYNRWVMSERDSDADLAATTGNILVETKKYQRLSDLFVAECDSLLASIDATVTRELEADENYSGHLAAASRFGAEAVAQDSATASLQAGRSLQAFVQTLVAMDKYVQGLDREIAELRGMPNTSSNSFALRTKIALRANIVALTGQKIDQFYDIVRAHIRQDAIYDMSHTSGGRLIPGSFTSESTGLNFINNYDGTNIQQTVSVVDKVIQGLDSAGGLIRLFKPKKSSSTSTTTVTKNGKVTSSSTTSSSVTK